MTSVLHVRRQLLGLVGSFCLLLIGFVAASADSAEIIGRVPRILILYPYDERLPVTNVAGEEARNRLLQATAGKIDLFSEFLDLSRFPEKEHVDRMARYLGEKYRDHRPDVVIALGAESARFIAENRMSIAADARIVFGGFGWETAEALHLPRDVVGVLTEFDIRKTVEMAARLQPDARKLVVMAGSSEFDQSWIATARADLADLTRNYDTTYLTGLSMDEFAERAAQLSTDTILVVLTIFSDRTGRNFVPREALEKITAVAGAPAYGPYATYLGHGIVGGNTVSFEAIGRTVAELAIAALGSKPVGDFVAPQSFVADARQLRRWGLSENALPPDTTVSFKEKTLWEQYWAETVSAIVVVALQGLVIAGLLLERKRRTAAEREARARLIEVVHLNQSATAGALSASIAHELNQPLGAIRVNAEAAEVILKSDKPDLELIHQILADIRDDDQRAGDIIVRLRGMLKKRGEVELQEFDLNDVIGSAIQILRPEAERRSVVVTYSKTEEALPIKADQVHLQQVVLNLATNAMDAMLEAGSAERKLLFQTKRTEASRGELSISDTGRGIPADMLASVFDTFYTTKPTGTGLGLSIARAIIETYGGKIWADNRPEGGAVFRFVLPLVQSG